jgi:UDP-4-amino-4,6-dideoxy-N-acetyl-beta-L-altrosamine N-acetyltransferase
MPERCILRLMEPHDLGPVLTWRNSPEVRSFMLTREEIDLATHERWYTSASADPKRRLLIVEEMGVPLGFVQFQNVLPAGACDWGFYCAPGAPKGSGRRLGKAALNHVFTVMQVHKVCGQALAFNTASLGLHKSLGFQQEGTLREQHCIEGEYQDLVCFGLLKQEWEARMTGEAHDAA